jgi:glycosyltransferase involved in cell wall biosynthesis
VFRLAYMTRLWTINGRFFTQRVTGVQRYAREIVGALDDLLAEGDPLGDNLELELIAPTSACALPKFKSIATRRAGRLTGHLWDQLALPLYARGGILSLCNTGTLIKKRQIVCIHDANIVLFPQSYSFAFRTLYHIVLPSVGRRSSLATTVSKYSAEQLTRLRWVDPSKLMIMPNGFEHVSRWTPRHSPVTKAVAGLDTIVLLGSVVPHKNVDLLLRLAKRLASCGLKLVVVGGTNRKVFHQTELKTEIDGVVWLGSISDDELAALLQDCLCLAFPSLAEGFGLPPLEAMALGCPVIVSDRTSLPEVGGDAVLYASAEDADQWLECFLALRRDQGLRQRQIAKGLARIDRFRWRASARLYLQAMSRVDANRSK